MDGNKAFTQDKGGIVKLCKECKVYDPFEHHDSNQSNAKSFINGQNKIYFLFCTFNLLPAIAQCGMTDLFFGSTANLSLVVFFG